MTAEQGPIKGQGIHDGALGTMTEQGYDDGARAGDRAWGTTIEQGDENRAGTRGGDGR